MIVKIGRRIPRKWFSRMATKAKGFLTFQENIWLIISRSMQIAKKKATEAGTLSFTKTSHIEPEDMHYNLQWIEVIINGNPAQEEEEYKEAMGMYKTLGKLFKKDFNVNDEMIKPFKTNRLTQKQIEEAYKQGHGAAENDTIAQKLLELGIITYVEKIDDKIIKQ